MGLRSWISSRFTSDLSRVDLVEPVGVSVQPPDRAGIASMPLPRPWSVARLRVLFEALEHQPSVASDQAARLARHQLSCFWLSVPVDELGPLYDGPLGDLQRLQLKGPLVQLQLAVDERRWRDRLLKRIEDPACAAERINLLLALMPYTQPRKLSVADPLSTLPDWLLNDYCVYCEPDLAAPVGLLEPAAGFEDDLNVSLTPLTDRRGEAAMALFRDQQAVAPMQQLIDQFIADPADALVHAELAGLRRVLAQLWLDVEPVQLQTLSDTPVGELTLALIRAGFSAVLDGQVDVEAREQVVSPPFDLSSPRGCGLAVAAVLFVPPGTVQVESVEGLPPWLLEILRQHMGG